MSTIQLECPSCQSLLELDSGFAGGVCRCSNCGTLMTVPADPSRERAESLTRPDAPGVAPRPPQPSRPTGPAGARPDRPGEPAAPVTTQAAPEPAAAAPVAEGDTITYTTASGKLVKLSRKIKIPTASAKTKRKVVRAGTYIVFFVVVGGILAFIVGVLVWMMSADRHRQESEQEQILAIEGHDPNANPFLMKEPNVLGIKIKDRVAIVVEAGSVNWLSTVKSAIEEGLKRTPSESQQQIVFYTDDAPRVFPETPGRIAQAEGLQTFLGGIRPAVDPSPDAAVDKAVEGKPQQLILITGNDLPSSSQLKLAEALKDKGVRLDVVSIGRDQSALQELAKEHRGIYLTMPPDRINDWYAKAHE